MSNSRGKGSIWVVLFIIIIVSFIVNALTLDNIAIYIVLVGACAGAIVGEKTNNKLPFSKNRKKK